MTENFLSPEPFSKSLIASAIIARGRFMPPRDNSFLGAFYFTINLMPKIKVGVLRGGPSAGYFDRGILGE